MDERRFPVIEDDPVRVAAERAADVLGWPGVVLPEVTVFGCRFLPVVVLDVAVHEVRQRDGDGPQLDGDVLAMWEWPESPSPASVARLSGGPGSSTSRLRPAGAHRHGGGPPTDGSRRRSTPSPSTREC